VARRKRGPGEETCEALIDSLTRRLQIQGQSLATRQTLEHELALAKHVLQILREAKL